MALKHIHSLIFSTSKIFFCYSTVIDTSGVFFQLSPHTGHFLLKQSDRLYFYLHVVTNSQNEPWSVRKRRLILNKPVVFPRLIKQAATAADSHLTPPRLQIQWQVCGGYHIAGPWFMVAGWGRTVSGYSSWIQAAPMKWLKVTLRIFTQKQNAASDLRFATTYVPNLHQQICRILVIK